MPSNSKNRPGECALTVWGIPIEIKANFKAACARRGRTIKEAIIEAMVREDSIQAPIPKDQRDV